MCLRIFRSIPILILSLFLLSCSSDDTPDPKLSSKEISYAFLSNLLDGNHKKSLTYIYGYDQLSRFEKNIVQSEFREISSFIGYAYGGNAKIKVAHAEESGSQAKYIYDVYIGQEKVLEYPVDLIKTARGWRIAI